MVCGLIFVFIATFAGFGATCFFTSVSGVSVGDSSTAFDGFEWTATENGQIEICKGELCSVAPQSIVEFATKLKCAI